MDLWKSTGPSPASPIFTAREMTKLRFGRHYRDMNDKDSGKVLAAVTALHLASKAGRQWTRK
jgi:hypothetical protein